MCVTHPVNEHELLVSGQLIHGLRVSECVCVCYVCVWHLDDGRDETLARWDLALQCECVYVFVCMCMCVHVCMCV